MTNCNPTSDPDDDSGEVDDDTGTCPLNCASDFEISVPCRVIKNGESLQISASETGDSPPGNYQWTTTSPNLTLSNDTTPNVTVKGDSPSASFEADTIKVTRSQAGCPDVEKEVKVTVYEFTEIKVTVKPTPANTARAGFAAPANHELKITSGSTDFAANLPIVLMRCKDRKADLELKAEPADLPIHWNLERNSDDHASLGAAGDLPALAVAADKRKATLDVYQKGSFRIRPFVTCDGSDTFDANHAPLCLNLVLANATVVRDKSRARTTNLSVTRANTHLRIVNGAWGPAPLSAATLAAAGQAMELISDVTGGGADGRLGLDQVFCGLINNVVIRDVFFHYRDTTPVAPAPATNHRIRLIAVSNQAAATGANATWGTFFQTGDPAPVLHALPLLDSGLTPNGIGGDTALMTRSQADPSTRVNRPVGQRWTTRCIDSPGTPMPRNHLGNANAVMNRIDYRYRFKAAFCFWTNRDKNRGQTDKMAERTYSVVREYNWEIRGVWNLTWPAASLPNLTATTAHTIRMSNRVSHNNYLEDAKDRSVEVRPPSGVAAGLSRDAQ